VPLGLFLKGKYNLLYKETEQTFNPQKLEMKSEIIGSNRRKLFVADIVIHKNTNINIQCVTPKNSKIILKWENKLYL